jgi:hypothetical protein
MMFSRHMSKGFSPSEDHYGSLSVRRLKHSLLIFFSEVSVLSVVHFLHDSEECSE